MTRAGEDIAVTPVDLAVERIRAVYRSWNRDTSVAQMRRDWDAAFGGCALPVSCSPINDGGVDGEWIAPADAPPDKAILYFHGGGFRVGSVASHRGLIAQRRTPSIGVGTAALNASRENRRLGWTRAEPRRPQLGSVA